MELPYRTRQVDGLDPMSESERDVHMEELKSANKGVKYIKTLRVNVGHESRQKQRTCAKDKCALQIMINTCQMSYTLW